MECEHLSKQESQERLLWFLSRCWSSIQLEIPSKPVKNLKIS